MSQRVASTPLAASLRPLLNQVPGLTSAVLLLPPEGTLILKSGDHPEETLGPIAQAAHRLLERSRDFQLDTHWLRLAADGGTLYALGAKDSVSLIITTSEARLSPHWLEQLEACLKHGPKSKE